MRVTLGVGRTGDDRLTDKGEHAADQDAEQLRALGYVSHFDRTMSKWENFSLGFTYLSPVVGVYTIFATAFVTGGPPMWWTYIAVGLGQLMVCLIFGEIVSQFPISGGLYPWARRLDGQALGLDGGLGVRLGTLLHRWPGAATGIAPFLAQLFGTRRRRSRPRSSRWRSSPLTTSLNLSGTRLLARVAMFGFVCELVGAIVVGGYLLLFARHQPLQRAGRHDARAHRRQLLAGVPRLLARRHVLLLRLRGLRRRRRGDAGPEPHDSEGHAHDHLHRRGRGDLGVPRVRALDSGHRRGDVRQGHRPDRHLAQGRHGRHRLSRRSSWSCWCRSSPAC